MPLTPRKIAHIKANIGKTLIGRQQQVILTLRTAAGGTTTMTLNAIWRVQTDADPTFQGPTADHFHLGTTPDVAAIFNQTDITLPQLKSCIGGVLGSGAQNAQPANKYTLLSVEPFGILPGGDRFFTLWTRQH